MRFEYPEDKQYFADILCSGNVDDLGGYSSLFDFRDPDEKRKEFNIIRNEAIIDLRILYGDECMLKLSPECQGKTDLVIDHFIPLSSNKLNKELRYLSPELGKKVRTQSFGSNHMDNFVLACSKCNAFKKHKIPDKELCGRIIKIKASKKYTDEQLEEIKRDLYSLADIALDSYFKSKSK